MTSIQRIVNYRKRLKELTTEPWQDEQTKKEIRRIKKNLYRFERSEVYSSLGLKKVKGALGGTYYE